MILFITVSTFVCVSLGLIGLYWAMFGQGSALTDRLRTVGRLTPESASMQVEENPVGAFAERLATPINNLLPPSPGEADKLRKKLMQAGYRTPTAPIIFRAIQLVSLVVFPLVVLFWATTSGKPLRDFLLYILIAVLLGFILPRYILDKRIKARQLRLRWGLADALDLMVVSIEAGLGLNAAMMRVSEELMVVHPDISKEFELANLEIRVGREREEALRNLADRTGVDDLRSLCAMLIQADRFGTSISRAVRVYAHSLRTKRRQRAEQAAQKAAMKLLFPLTCFLFPAFLLTILGPAVLSLYDNFINL